MSVRVYYILGIMNSGRRQVVADLIEHGLPEGTSVAIYVHEAEITCAAAEESFSANPNVSLFNWRLHEGKWVAALPPENTNILFVMGSGIDSPIDALEGFPDWLKAHDLSLSRVITVIDADKTSQHPIIQKWYEACLYFSDVVLFTHRHGACPPGWVESYIEDHRKACYPCVFMQVKKKQVDNPALVLDTTVRRLSQIFDSPNDFDGDWGDLVIEGDVDDNTMPQADPYFERLPNGEKAKPVAPIPINLLKNETDV
jgi:hypothetical protein